MEDSVEAAFLDEHEHFSSLFQTARALCFLRAAGRYSKRGAYSWRGETRVFDDQLYRSPIGGNKAIWGCCSIAWDSVYLGPLVIQET